MKQQWAIYMYICPILVIRVTFKPTTGSVTAKEIYKGDKIALFYTVTPNRSAISFIYLNVLFTVSLVKGTTLLHLYDLNIN